MVGIIVKPSELTQMASEILSHAKILQVALDAIDADIRALGPSVFESARADVLRSRYNKIREGIYRFKPLIEYFAKNLDEVAARFSAADKA